MVQSKISQEEDGLVIVNENEVNFGQKKSLHWSFNYELEEFIPVYDLVTEWFMAEASKGRKKVSEEKIPTIVHFIGCEA